EHVLLLVHVPPEFLTDSRRGLNRYEALKMRIGDEVRDRRYQNPLGALIRLGSWEADEMESELLQDSQEAEGQGDFNCPTTSRGDVGHQRAMEALRSGVPNAHVVQVLGSHQPEVEGKFRRLLHQMEEHVPCNTPTKGLIIEGGFGSGKSHL